MKNIILLLLFTIFVKNFSYDDGILSKFHQHGYTVRDYRGEVISYNKKYFNIFEIKTFKYNRTTPALNSTYLNMKINVFDKMEVLVQAFKFLSNEYRHFLVRLQLNVKKVLNANVVGIREALKCGNLTSTDYFQKDVTYHTCNFVVDETHLPPLIPSGRYKVDARLLYLNEEIATIYGFGEIYTPIEYPKD